MVILIHVFRGLASYLVPGFGQAITDGLMKGAKIFFSVYILSRLSTVVGNLNPGWMFTELLLDGFRYLFAAIYLVDVLPVWLTIAEAFILSLFAAFWDPTWLTETLESAILNVAYTVYIMQIVDALDVVELERYVPFL